MQVEATIIWPGPLSVATSLDWARPGELTQIDGSLWLDRRCIGRWISISPRTEEITDLSRSARAGRAIVSARIIETYIDLMLEVPTPDPEPVRCPRCGDPVAPGWVHLSCVQATHPPGHS